MKADHVAIIGFGAIAQDLVSILNAPSNKGPKQISVLVRDGRQDATRAQLNDPGITVVSDLAALMQTGPDVVVECAGHGAIKQFAPPVLEQGIDFIIASVGALADPVLKNALETAAHKTNAQCVVPSGAIGGIDALVAAQLSGLRSVTYTGCKPPSAWMGTPAEQVINLQKLTESVVFFEGTARDAAQNYPKNANVAATLALAGLGMDATKVRLVADPGTLENTHAFTVISNASEFEVRFVGKPSTQNPKTSQSTVYSIARAVLNRNAAIAI